MIITTNSPRRWSAGGWDQTWALQRPIHWLQAAPAGDTVGRDHCDVGVGDIVHVDDEVGVVGHLVVLIHEVVQQPPFVWSAVSSCHFCQFYFFYLQINFDLSRDGWMTLRSSARRVIVASDDHFEVKVADLVSDDGLGDGVVFVVIINLNTEVLSRYWGSWQRKLIAIFNSFFSPRSFEKDKTIFRLADFNFSCKLSS